MNNIYPYGQQTLDKNDINEVIKSLNSSFITGGKLVERFEKKIKTYSNSKYAVCCSSGTAALTLLFESLGIDNKSNVLIPNITFNATAAAVKKIGGNVYFCDVDPNMGIVTTTTLLKALSEIKVKINYLVIVHLNGNSVDIDEIYKIANKNNIKILADGCHALGTLYKNKLIGGGKKVLATTFSFHAVKAITAGEGGAIVTDCEKIAEYARLQRNHGINRNCKSFKDISEAYDINGRLNTWYYEIDDIGHNFRLTDFQCALGISQIKKVENFVKKRRVIAGQYIKKLKNFSPIIKPVGNAINCNSSFHLFPILIDFSLLSITKSKIMSELSKKNIFSQVHYIPLSKFLCWKKPKNTYDGSLSYYSRVLSLPIYPNLKKRDVDYICNELGEILKNASKN